MTSAQARSLAQIPREAANEARRHPAEGAVDTAVAAWRDIEAALVPLIGPLGFGALYQRCIALRSKEDPWLARAHRGVSGWDDFAALHVALGGRPDAEALVAHRELLRTLHEVLVSLLGEPLVARLLPVTQRGPP